MQTGLVGMTRYSEPVKEVVDMREKSLDSSVKSLTDYNGYRCDKRRLCCSEGEDSKRGVPSKASRGRHFQKVLPSVSADFSAT